MVGLGQINELIGTALHQKDVINQNWAWMFIWCKQTAEEIVKIREAQKQIIGEVTEIRKKLDAAP